MHRLPVESSDIVSVGYDPAERILEVEFQRGRIYQYREVEPEIHAQFMRADSYGIFFFAHINGRYRYQKISSLESEAAADHTLAFVGAELEELRSLQIACEPYEIAVEPLDLPVDDIQAEDGEIVALKKAKQAYWLAKQPVVVSVVSWNILALHGFPGVLAAAIFRWLSALELIKLLEDKTDRTIAAIRLLVYYDGKRHKVFRQDYWGTLGDQPRGEGSPLEQLVRLTGQEQTLAERRAQGLAVLTVPEETVWQECATWLRLQRRLHLF